jgi:hypothetical protein
MMDAIAPAPVVVDVVAPGTMRLALSDEKYLVVKCRLTAGETLDLFERAAPDADLTAINLGKLSPAKVGFALLLAYVVDWNFLDVDGRPLEWRYATLEARESVLRALSFERFTESMLAVTRHDTAIRQEKKRPATGSGS